MNKLQKISFGIILLLLAAMVYMEATKPEALNWYPSYTNTDKIPFGTYVLFDLLKDRFQDDIQEISMPPFEALLDSTLTGTYVFINDELSFDKAEFEKLHAWVEKGNDIFASSSNLGRVLQDTFQLELQTAWDKTIIGTEPLLELTNSKLKGKDPYHIDIDLLMTFFSEIDTLNQTILGVSQIFNDTLRIREPDANFLQVPVGEGNFFLHLQPEAFTNYFLLTENNHRYTEGVLSYLDTTRALYWDNHYKSGKTINISPLHILFENKYFKTAYYFVLIGALLFILFEGKRKQRPIKIVKPLPNKTFEYTQIIAGMYLDKKEYHKIALKQIVLFMEYVRTRLRVPTEKINTSFFNSVAARSGNSFDDTKELFTFIEKIQHQQDTTKEELIELHKKITAYKHRTDGKS